MSYEVKASWVEQLQPERSELDSPFRAGLVATAKMETKSKKSFASAVNKTMYQASRSPLRDQDWPR